MQHIIYERERKNKIFDEMKYYQDKIFENIKKYSSETTNRDIYYFGYKKEELIKNEDKEKFKDDIEHYLKFKANFNYLYKKYPVMIDDLLCDITQLIVNK